MEQLRTYIRESYDELLHKVTWPTWANLQSTTIVVLVATFVMSLLIFIMDTTAKQVLEMVYSLGGSN